MKRSKVPLLVHTLDSYCNTFYNYVIFKTILECTVSVVEGTSYSSSYPVSRVLTYYVTDSGKMWLAPNKNTGNFTLDLGCETDINKILMVNTHNAGEAQNFMHLLKCSCKYQKTKNKKTISQLKSIICIFEQKRNF